MAIPNPSSAAELRFVSRGMTPIGVRGPANLSLSIQIMGTSDETTSADEIGPRARSHICAFLGTGKSSTCVVGVSFV